MVSVRTSATTAISARSAATPAGSAPSFDGIWSVVIVTQKGACDRAYRYPIRIRNGALAANDELFFAEDVGRHPPL